MTWDFSTDPDFQEQLDWMSDLVRSEIWPLETIWRELGIDGLREAIAPLAGQVKERGLWAAHLPPELGGQGMGQVRLGLIHEILGTSPIAPLAFGNAAPDSGNSEILALAGTPEQKERYLYPLLEGDLKSAFSMTEPDTAGSDPTLLKTTAVRDGEEWVINGHKWFSSNGWIADSAAQMQAARLMTLQAAWKMDTEGVAAARQDIALIKFYGAQVLHDVIDRAIQAHGALGYSTDLPLEAMYRFARAARIYDGPDEVHRQSVARQILRGYAPPADGVPGEHVPTRRAAARQKFAELLDAVTAND